MTHTKETTMHTDPNQAAMFVDGESIERSPVRPYAGTIGWSGSDTSRERAERQPAGKTQRAVVEFIARHGYEGATVAEIRDATGMHHGTVSGALTDLHKYHVIARLADKRRRCKIYVLPNYVAERETEQVTPTKAHLGNRVESCEIITDRDGHRCVNYHDVDYYSAADLLEALTADY